MNVKKRRIIAATLFLAGGTIMFEMQTGGLSGSEANAASAAGGGGLLAPIIPLPGVHGGGASGGGAAGGGSAPGTIVVAGAADDRQPPAATGGDTGGPITGGGGAESPVGSGQLLVLGLGGGGPLSGFAPVPVAGAGGFASGGDPGGAFGGDGAARSAAFTPSPSAAISGVPEPASWISLITGLLLVGVNIRQRRGARSVSS
jgi:hypothetical protein